LVRTRILLALVTCLALLAPAAAAQASTRQFTLVEAPNELLGSGAPEASLDLIQSLGAGAIRVQMAWSSIAPSPDASRAPAFNPTDPAAYPAAGWAPYDRLFAAAHARGSKIYLTLTGPAPRWATATHRDNLTNPSATQYGKFATAVGRRYRADVSWWSLWNEPNLGKLLKPLYKGRGETVLASAPLYRQLYLKGYGGLKAAGVSAPILLGELAPQANSLHENGTIAPLRFLRGVLCLDSHYRKSPKCAALPTQGFAMHPYTPRFGPRFRPANADNVTIGVIARLEKALDRAAHAHALAAHLPIYVSEFGIQSYPDHQSGVPLAVQSDYRSLAEYMAYKDRRIASFSQYLLRDDATLTGSTGHFESGLFLFEGGTPKPSLVSFRLPLVVVQGHGGGGTLWGLVRPAHGTPGTLTVQFADHGGAWTTLATQSYPGSGYWTRRVREPKGRAWRVVWTAADGTTYSGPATLPR
jgi:hypothetical protein